MTNKKCPKCGSRDFQVVDYEIRAYLYEVKDGYVTADGIDEDSYHAWTNCVCRKCGQVWHPRRLNDNFIIDK